MKIVINFLGVFVLCLILLTPYFLKKKQSITLDKGIDGKKLNKSKCISYYEKQLILDVNTLFIFFDDLRFEMNNIIGDETKLVNKKSKHYFLIDNLVSEKEKAKLLNKWYDDENIIFFHVDYTPKGFNPFMEVKFDNDKCDLVVTGETLYIHKTQNLSMRIQATQQEQRCDSSSNYYVIYIDMFYDDGTKSEIMMTIKCKNAS